MRFPAPTIFGKMRALALGGRYPSFTMTNTNANSDRTVPYVPAATIDKFFERIRTVKPPAKVDNEWAVAYKFAPPRPSALPSMLQWLGVADDNGEPDPVTWENLRHPDSRPETLAALVRDAYSAVFEAADVERLSREQLSIEFARAYALGSAGERVTCFLKLCSVAGIELEANDPSTKRGAQGPSDSSKRASPRAPKSKGARTDGGSRDTGRSGAPKREATPPQGPGKAVVNINLDVSIPAEWSTKEVRDRLRVVSEAVKEFGIVEA